MRLFGKRTVTQRRIRNREEFHLIHTSGVEGFAFEAEHEGLSLLGFDCDEEDGPVTIFFHPERKRYEINLEALRKLLDDAGSALIKRRRDWRAMPPLEE